MLRRKLIRTEFVSTEGVVWGMEIFEEDIEVFFEVIDSVDRILLERISRDLCF